MKKARKTPTAEQKQWMKENGYTEKQMDAFWEENIESNPIIRNLNSNGMTWRDMSLSCVSQLPTQKERDLKRKEKKKLKNNKKQKPKRKQKPKKNTIMSILKKSW